ncbi:hypothetical protein O0I10_005825 [Lichtheimia ornata]|uniref:Glycoside hydrolase family 28 protein n=1 Tax=Lichtheimia ornata TaxID=688661 RepID=A0AAD7V5G1_9FUNG|nr:uncharacterized protein O0I10_005825 [Lichtheimia ornata]KAJ8658472.1 hypothetical protein O0I10_005825 [Lichtheimia ornata]
MTRFSILGLFALATAVVNALDCNVGKPSGGDDTPQILEAIEKCAAGGTVNIPAGDYTLGTPIEKEGLKDVVINIEGNLVFPATIDEQKKPGTRNWIWLEGTGVTITGGGTLDGNGQVWYDTQELDDRFAMLGLQLQDSSVSNLRLVQPCNNFFNVRESNNLNFTDLYLSAESNDPEKPPHNTDGFDLTNCDTMYMANIEIHNQDDCIAYKNGTSHVTVENVYCSGGHGFSVGSLGKDASFGYNTEISMTNMTCEGCWAVAQIKYYASGSTGEVSHFHCKDFKVKDVKIPVWVNSHYPCDVSEFTEDGGCKDYPGPSKIQVSDLSFEGFTGTTNGAYDNNVIIFDCPYGTNCQNIVVKDFDVTSPKGDPSYVCNNIDEGHLEGIDCEITQLAKPTW